MLRNEGNVVVLVGVVLVELGTGEAVGDGPVQGVVKQTATKRSLQTAGVALASIHHHASVVAIRFHDRQLLVADLHIIERKVEMQQIVEEVQVRSHLVVPRLLRLVTDRLIDGGIVRGSMT